jgi:hypothetical protein
MREPQLNGCEYVSRKLIKPSLLLLAQTFGCLLARIGIVITKSTVVVAIPDYNNFGLPRYSLHCYSTGYRLPLSRARLLSSS